MKYLWIVALCGLSFVAGMRTERYLEGLWVKRWAVEHGYAEYVEGEFRWKD